MRAADIVAVLAASQFTRVDGTMELRAGFENRTRKGAPMKSNDRFLSILIVCLCLGAYSGKPLSAQTEGQKPFPSSTEAVNALVDAVRARDKSALLTILGGDSESIISSGDPVADKAERDSFLSSYDHQHRLIASGPHAETLEIGKDNWPLPIPVVKSGGSWYFDTAAGKEELLYRRIGHNELAAINVCNGVVSAQHDYAASGHDGLAAGIYAQKLLSSPGKQDGLYWHADQDDQQSPLGPLVANAAAQGYGGAAGPTPYHGYYYRILTQQGPAARGGAKDYVQNGEMTGGFALIAYPAEYRNSGVMTFVVNQSGVVYQKDLGEKTAELISAVDTYNPDKTWTPIK